MLHYLYNRPAFCARLLFIVFYTNLCVTVSATGQAAPSPAVYNGSSVKRPASFIPESNKENAIYFAAPLQEQEAALVIASTGSDIDGPGQPEMGSFQSVNSSDMVDLFTGDFSYNLPLMDVGGYPVNIHYGSGISMDQEASWVGLGWNINPGTISRSVRGIPDDFNGSDSISTTQTIRNNKTVGGGVGGSLEIKGLPIKPVAKIGVFHNNYNGWGIETGINAVIDVARFSKGNLTAGLGLGLSNNSQTGLDVTPSLDFSLTHINTGNTGQSRLSTNYNSRSGIAALTLSTEVRKNVNFERMARRSGLLGLSPSISFAIPAITPTISMPLSNSQFAFSLKPGGSFAFLFPNAFFEGYVSKQSIAEEDRTQKLPAYGYMHFSKAKQSRVLLDFNREKDIPFNEKSTPHIAIPQYTYDIFSMSGEGTGGMFRSYRGDVGFIHDHLVRTKSNNSRFSGDFGAGGFFHGGVDFSNVNVVTESGPWLAQNALKQHARFALSDTTFQEAYFRNPGEKTVGNTSFFDQLGGDSLIRVKLNGTGINIAATSQFTKFSSQRPAGDLPVNSVLAKKKRDKRTQQISYLNAYEAARYGLEPAIRSYLPGMDPVTVCDESFTEIDRIDGTIRKAHHLSEIRVTNGDGRRYVYGLPVYNVEQVDVTFSVDKETDEENLAAGLADYVADEDNTVDNEKGKEAYFKRDSMPAYAHSFLLTGILSPDYVDIKGDGITADDIGDGIKFNYTQVYGAADDYYGWRTPHAENKANYNEGLKTYSRDDKGTYLYGKKEVWYMHSIESKTMIAFFRTGDREDAYSIADENGSTDMNKPLKKLDSIELFVKADLIKNGSQARPVKTVHFRYSYNLCPGYYFGDGKLTLDSIWFTYNGNHKGKLNPYVFYYHPDPLNDNLPKEAGNPAYNAKSYDRWGNYKPETNNPGALSNNDYPYADQNKASADLHAGAWHLTDIKLPSGGRMRITYEADDYAYVQNKRAAQFLPIAGFGASPSANPVNALYGMDGSDYYYVFVDATASPVHHYADIKNNYLEGIEKIFFKIAVQMPSNQWGSGWESVPVYGEPESYGLVTGNVNRFWIRLKPVAGTSPLTKAALQYLRLNLPSKAYPASELGDNIDLEAAVKMLISGMGEIKNSVLGFEKASKSKKWCRTVAAHKSFIRLNSPAYQKIGGGHRVKRVEIYDNWKNMTGAAALKEAVYGQEYNYTRQETLNGVKRTISSGVATYEPMIGADENPFRIPVEYIEKLAPLGPSNLLYTETPLGESFFPSPMVGYSKVRVRTINAKAKSANGWEESEFYTTKDFPTQADFTPMDGESKKRYNPKLKNLLRINAKHHLTLSQGFRIELTDMNGKLKRQASYPENDSLSAIHETINYYKVKNNRSFQQQLDNEVWTIDSSNGYINKQGVIGKEVELMLDFRQQVTITTSNSFSPNVDVIPFFLGPLPVPSFIRLPQYEENRFRSVSATKIVQRYGILDSVVVMDNGSVVSTKNLVYDAETGEPVLTRTNNEFDDPVYNFSYPAHWMYEGMGAAYRNTDALLFNKRIIDGVLTERNGAAFNAERMFSAGDEVWITGRKIAQFVTLPDDCPLPIPGEIEKKMLWVIDAAKGLEGDRGLYFIDAEGKSYSGFIDSLRIVRSGRRNMVTASAGAIVSLDNPVREISEGIFRVVFDTTSKVINATAAVFKDAWKVENPMYAKDTTVEVLRNYSASVLASSVNRRSIYTRTTKPNETSDLFMQSPGSIVSSYNFIRRGTGCHSRLVRSKSMIQFDLGMIPPTATITNAAISFTPGLPDRVWPQFRNDCSRTFNSYNWNSATDFHEGDSRVYLKRIIANWNQGTLYNSIVTTTQNQVQLSSTNYNNVSVTNLIQDAISNMNFGLLFETLKQSPSSSSASEINYLSFCANHMGNAITPSCNDCICSRPYLEINYANNIDSTYSVCRYSINDSASNPYRWGILGNWRMDKAYTYYSDRKETDASLSQTNIREEGTIKNFQPFWALANPKAYPAMDTNRWVWNTAISLYNRKGFEIENYDPLGRYNAGLYGYSQTLPVAVAQNSRYREILSDGFEDYGYRSNNCDTACVVDREVDFLKGNTSFSIAAQESHTGKNSLRVATNAQGTLTIPVVALDATAPTISAKVDSAAIMSTTVTGRGTGLAGTYECDFMRSNSTVRTDAVINFSSLTLPSGVCPSFVTMFAPGSVIWRGKLQPKYTDTYYFHALSTTSSLGIKIGSQVVLEQRNTPGTAERTSVPVSLEAGKLYDIVVSYPAFYSNARAVLSWSSQSKQLKEVIPQANLYLPTITTSDTVGSVNTQVLKYCVALNNIRPFDYKRPVFSPVKGSTIVVSAWMKMNSEECAVPDAAEQGVIQLDFDQGSDEIILEKTGIAIEGWQRYESVVTVPVNASAFYITIRSPEGNGVYVDDIRVHPFNSNMKGFVYDPESLRLMAELDDNNYASFYEYDDDGTLIRVKKETERGIKTIKETRSALFKEE